MKNGPNEALLALNESVKKHTITEYTKWEAKRIRDIKYDTPLEFNQSITEKILSITDVELKNTLLRIMEEQDTIRKAYKNRSDLMRSLANKNLDQLTTAIRSNSFKRRLTDISVSFVRDQVQTVTTINPDGQMVTFAFNGDTGTEVVNNPEWLENFDLYKNKRAITHGKNSSYHEDNDRRRYNSGRSNNGNNNYNRNNGGNHRQGPYDRDEREQPRNFERNSGQRNDRYNRY